MHAQDDRLSPQVSAPVRHLQADSGGFAPDAAACWLHDLRNAVNTASVASAVVRRMLEAGMADAALEMVPELERACARCNALLSERPGTGGLS